MRLKFWASGIQGEACQGTSGKDIFVCDKKDMENSSFLALDVTCVDVIELWQPLCDHEGKVKRIIEKLNQILLGC